MILRVRLLIPLLGICAYAAPLRGQSPDAGELESATFEDYGTSVGRLEDGILHVSLAAREATWRPWADKGPAVRVNAFSADGGELRVPGPLIRVTVGTPVVVTLRNQIPRTLVVRGLHDRGQTPVSGPAAAFGDSVAVAAGGTTEVRFTPTVPGVFIYYGRAVAPGARVPPRLFGGDRGDGPFVGVLIVDPPGIAPPRSERIFLITQWADPSIRASFDPDLSMMLNGRSWPHTERLRYTEGDTVRWRVINATGIHHPMHLHGFHFRVDARGDQFGETVYPAAERRMVVTEALGVGETMRLTWVPEEPGNWIFHCHFMRHMSWTQAAPHEGSDTAHAPPAVSDATSLLGGLVLGITVQPGEARPASADLPRKRLRLYTGMRARVFGDAPAYGFVLQEGDRVPVVDSVRIPGSPVVLTRGEPTEIVVHNRIDQALGVHWHGLELESRFDGVPDWSGLAGGLTPPIPPGDSLVVRMTPPRAGTFMYHVHSEPGHELAQGLYGAFLVMPPGDEWDPETDRIFVLGSRGAERFSAPAINGRVEPDPVEVRPGVAYRLRFMHISPDDDKRVTLLRDGEPIEWTPVAKDGADLPPPLVRAASADFSPRVGETFDFVWTPDAAGDFTLRVVTRFPNGPPEFPSGDAAPHTADVVVRVR